MIVGVMSDTHDHLERIAKALEALHARHVEALIHLGDFVAPFAMKAILKSGLPVHAIFGNNDGERTGLKMLLPSLRDGPTILEIGGRKLGMAHAVTDLPQEYRQTCDALLYGHSHARELVTSGSSSPLMLNPGEACGWLTGKATCAVLDLGAMKAEIVEI